MDNLITARPNIAYTTVSRGYDGSETNFFDWGGTPVEVSEVKVIVPPKPKDFGIKTKLKADKEDCVICLELMKKGDTVRILDCTHMFHEECAKEFENNKCPLCRTESKTT